MPKPQNVTDDQIKEALLSGMKNIRTTLHCKPERISRIRKELIMQKQVFDLDSCKGCNSLTCRNCNNLIENDRGTDTKEHDVPVPKEQKLKSPHPQAVIKILNDLPDDLDQHRIDNVSAFRNLLLRELEMMKGDRDVLLVRCLCQQKVHIVQNYILPFLERLDKDIQLIQEMTNNI